MDLKDLLSFQPNREVVAEKRPAADEAPAAAAESRKRKRVSPPRASGRQSRFDNPMARLVPPEAIVSASDLRAASSSSKSTRWTQDGPVSAAAASGSTGIDEEERQRILKMVEEANPEAPSLDSVSVKKMLLAFDRKVLKNREMRIKYPDTPQKFLESEMEVHDDLQQLHALSTVPQLYPLLVDSNIITSLLSLLSHDNSDIALAVIDLLHELTDVDVVRQAEEEEDDEEDEASGAKMLIDALLQGNCLAHFVQNMERLDEKQRDDGDGVHNTLGIVENLCEFGMDTVCSQAVQQGLMHWLVKRVKVRGFDANKLYASEILSILLQNSTENRRVLGDLNGVDILLQSLAVYKRRDPASNEETELMENLFDCLCLALMHPANRQKFLDGEGPQLMILMLKEKKQSFSKALKVLDHALSNPEGADNCAKFVEVFGLRSLFPLFMKTPKKKVRKGSSRNEHEEHVCTIVASLFRNLTANTRQRLFNKFKENDYEKIDRLVELHGEYYQKVLMVDRDIDTERRRLGQKVTAENEDEFYLRRLDSGLFSLQSIDYILAEVIVNGESGARPRALKLLSQHGDSVRTLKRTLKELSESIGDADTGNSLTREAERHRIAELLTQL
ncbi:beta-catenin-like protein 1 [Sycon ciliatum]|uniref:beta-catenin-like protein 1 n=1 Tax=Sycon ciliatum TaxID=27933 RepID=UPI0020AA793F|eukprot:scpid41523/ scgid23185/ Beta-catenin-like protein 1; Nuclear-associated protein